MQCFKEYLKRPIIQNYDQYDDKVNVKISEQKQRYNLCNLSNKNKKEENTLVVRYLSHFFLYDGCKINDFQSFFKNDFIQREYAKAVILLGQEYNEAGKLLGSEYEQLVKKIELTICPHNKKNFDIKETVLIEVDVKNIQTLFVKIFEINTENYYYTKKTNIDSAISLEGLIATYEENFIYNETPPKY